MRWASSPQQSNIFSGGRSSTLHNGQKSICSGERQVAHSITLCSARRSFRFRVATQRPAVDNLSRLDLAHVDEHARIGWFLGIAFLSDLMV